MTTATIRRPRTLTMRTRRRIFRPLQYLALFGYIFFLGFPLLFLVTATLKTPSELQSVTTGLFPSSLYLGNITAALEKVNLIGALGNSLLVAGATTLAVVVISIPAAYVLSRTRSKIRGVAFGWILLSQMFPFILIVIPLFLLLTNIGLVNSLLGLTLVYSVWCLPFALWMLQGHIRSIPIEIEEAGAIDGASRVRVLVSLVLPVLAPGIVATSLFTFVTAYSDFFFALVTIRDERIQTLPLALARFVGAEGIVQLGPLAAASLIATIPGLIFFAFIQRKLSSGLLSGAVKG
ncbi:MULTISPECIES: carbohydrate ABC transporter permease [Microbacterium]|uniref:carbohydrate ABC transporter permease n=1 Tax=Microbacterium TaxID=33882 RepID=UPI00278142D7|nr:MULTISPECIES: carbohydrate ABC transporter permease [Microbacterium]MDQ1082662.1 multiple sugar transport system permease protein [Microbacterium sp. SORGH_AS_0344]MDQ1168566.1 multiple sugar transport system permease protein [Microbacterium proteolyticum]